MKKILNEQYKPQEELTTEQSSASITSVRQPYFSDTIAYTLTPNRLYSIIKQLKTGDARDYLTFADELEYKDPHYRSVLGTRKSQVANLPCSISPATDEDKDVEIAESVNRFILKASWFKKIKKDLLDALGKGYAVCEIIWANNGSMWIPKDVKYRDPRYFRYDRDTLTRLVLDEAGEEVELIPNKYIIHEPHLKSGQQLLSGLALPCSYYHLVKSFDIAGWAALAQVYGYPLRIGKYGQNASENDKKVLKKAIANLGKDIGCTIPDNMQIEIINGMTGTGNITLYNTLADWLDKQISKAVLGQTMSTDAEGGQYKGDLHNAIRLELQRDDAGDLAETLQRDLIIPFVNFNYGEQELYPEIKIQVSEPENIELIVNSVEKLVPMGLKVRADDFYSRLNLVKPKEGDELLTPQQVMPYSAETNVEMNSEELNKDKEDEFEELEDEELGDWEVVMKPYMEELKTLCKDCTSYDEVLKKLPALLKKYQENDKDTAESFALSFFKARVLGASEYNKD